MRKTSTGKRLLPSEIINHYEGGIELHRLSKGTGLLELFRTQEIIKRYLFPPGIILDIGGGPGIYSCWLARQGYEVHLIDATPLHIEQARRASHRQPHHPIASITLGDARKLNWKNASVDAIPTQSSLMVDLTMFLKVPEICIF